MTRLPTTRDALARLRMLVLMASLFSVSGAECHASSATPPRARIVYAASMDSDHRYKLYLADWPDPKPTALAPRVIGKYKIGDSIVYPHFSPDGTKVLFLANRKLPNGKLVETDGYLGTDLWILDIVRNTAKPLTTDGDGYEEEKWLPDGRYVCAISHEGCPPPEAPADLPDMWKLNLYVWEVSTGKRWFIARNVDSVVWSRDSRSLYYDGIIANDLPAILEKSRTGGTPCVVLGGGQSVYGLSPDRKRSAYWQCDEEGKNCDLILKTLATNTKKVLLAQSCRSIDYLWMPDNQTLGLSYGGKEGTCGVRMCYWLFLDTSSGRTRRTVDIPDLGGIVAWSRTWDWIISYRYSKPLNSSTGYLVAISTKTGEIVTLIQPPQAGGFDWHDLPAK